MPLGLKIALIAAAVLIGLAITLLLALLALRVKLKIEYREKLCASPSNLPKESVSGS